MLDEFEWCRLKETHLIGRKSWHQALAVFIQRLESSKPATGKRTDFPNCVLSPYIYRIFMLRAAQYENFMVHGV